MALRHADPWHGRGVLLVYRNSELSGEHVRVAEAAGLRVAGRTRSKATAIARLSEPGIDAVLLILGASADKLEAFSLIQEIGRRAEDVRVVVLSPSDEPDEVRAALAAGAAAYVVSDAHSEDVISAIHQAFAHTVYTAHSERLASRDDAKMMLLTPREAQVLSLVCQGHANKHVALTLSVSEETVKFHLSNVYRKLGVSNRTEASLWAHRLGFRPQEEQARPAATETDPAVPQVS
jgi:DNA-binding NarL/FixJ family response regulator